MNNSSLKGRLIVMNFLEFAVWGAYLTSMGNYLGRAGMGADVIQQGSQAVLPGFVLPVPAQQLAADLIAGSFDLKSGLQCFVGHNVSPSYNQKTEEAQPPPSFIYIIN